MGSKISESDSIPVNARNALNEGNRHYFSEPPDYASAEQYYRKAIGLAPRWGDAYHALGSALMEQNKSEDACEAARTAINLLPSDPRPLISLGWYLLSSGHVTEAIRFLEQGVSLKPHYAEADALCMLAEAYERGGEVKKAIPLWRQVTNMDAVYPSHDRPMNEARKKLAEYGATAG